MADKNGDVVTYIEEQLGKMGVKIDSIHLEVSDENRKLLDGKNDREIISKSYAGKEDELLNNIMQNIAKSIRPAEEKASIAFPSFVEKFKQDPTSESIVVLKKMAIKQWKECFKKARIYQANGKELPLSYSDEDLKKVLTGLELVYDFDYNTIKALEVEADAQDLSKVLYKKIAKFAEEVNVFSERVKMYREAYETIQKTVETIEEFEEQFNEYSKTDIQKYGKSLAEHDKYVFDAKRDVEQTLAACEQKTKKAVDLLKKAYQSKQNLEKRREEDKGTAMQGYYGELDPFFAEHAPETELKHMEAKAIVLRENKNKFQQDYEKRLVAKQELKDVINEIDCYIKVSKKEKSAS